MINCKHVARQISSGDKVKLTFLQKAKLHFHMSICIACKRYKKHMFSLSKGASNLYEQFFQENKEVINELEKKSIMAILKDRS